MMIRRRKRLWAMFLSAALVITQLPALAMAENMTPGQKAIASFELLPGNIANQTVPVGTEESELDLPDELTATVYHATEDTVIPDDEITDDDEIIDEDEITDEETDDIPKASPGNAEGGTSGNDGDDLDRSEKTVTTVTTSKEQIPVTWDSVPAYDGEAEGSYVFTANVGDYILSDGVEPPQITVTVGEEAVETPEETQPEKPAPCAKTEGCTLADGHEGECVPVPQPDNSLVKTIISWTFIDDDFLNEGELPLPGVSLDHQADFDTVVSMLPTQISAEIDEEETATVDITGWSCDTFTQDADGNWPLTGDYIFTAEPETGYVLASEAAALEVKVVLDEADTYEQNNTVEAGGITIVASNGGEVAYADGSGFVLSEKGDYIISGEWNGTLTDVSISSKTAVITVPDGVTANITLSGVNINVSGTDLAYSFAVEAGGTANITLSGTNTLTSGYYRAGLEVPENAAVTLDGDGSLKVTGGSTGAGIGGGGKGSGGKITISGGEVTARSGTNGGAGIGGGAIGGGGEITISGGTVEATGSSGGAGIGGGSNGDGGIITISGGNVTANGSGGSAGIGIGYKGNGGKIIISGGEVEAYSYTGAGIGSSSGGDGGEIIINDGNVTAKSDFGAGIGGGKGGNGGNITINGGIVTAESHGGAGIGGGSDDGHDGGNGGNITISGGKVTAESHYGAGIGGGNIGGDGGTVEISGQGTIVTANSTNSSDVGSGWKGNNGGSLSVTDGATLEMQGNGTNATDPTYQNCTIIDQGNHVEYDAAGKAHPTLTLKIDPADSVTLPYTVTLTATLSGAGPNLSGKEITFTVGGTTATGTTDNSGVATYTPASLSLGTHSFSASFGGDTKNASASATDITGYQVLDTQNALTLNGLSSTYTYGATAFQISTSGGSGSGAVSYISSNPSVASVSGDTVTIHKAGTFTITATKAADSTYNQATATLEITVAPRAISYVTVSVTGDRIYTGSQLQPVFEVTDSGIAINTGDYTNSYGTNADAGIGAGSITLTGQRNYTGTKTVPFDIDKRSLTGAIITLEQNSYSYTGGAIEPAITGVTVDGISVPASAYDVSYANNISAGPATVTITATANGNFSGTVSTNFTITGNNNPSGNSGGNVRSSYTPPAQEDSYIVTGDKISKSISRSDLQWLVDTGKSLTLSCDKAGMTFDLAALKTILVAVPATAGNVTFAAAPADLSAFPDAAALIGSRPAYDFTISYKDSKGNIITAKVDFAAGSAAVTLTYPRSAEETEGSLFMVYVDDKGAVTWLDKSSYDSGKVLADAPHFSVYGVACKAPATVFTDTANHWAKNDIEFVAARGLLTGTGNNQFSPDATMTRGMFVTALGRLAGINPASYKTRSFTDVTADAYYAAYVEWAAQKNIVKGTGEGLFSPDAPVTREQIAVIMTNYAGQMGYFIPAPLAEVPFADSDKISEWAAKEVTAMQRAGIVRGKDGNRFDPQASATRAEVSAVLRRFVEIVIDPATAGGWVQNDSGHWLYYRNGHRGHHRLEL